MDAFDELYYELQNITIPIKRGRNNRRGFPTHRAMSLGIIKKRFSGKIELSAASLKYPSIYEKINAIGKSFNFPFTSIHLNNNVVCPRHKDEFNVGDSLIVSFGEYTGGSLIVDEKPVDTFKKPVIFNGSLLEHYNTNDLVGNKYSIVFFTPTYLK